MRSLINNFCSRQCVRHIGPYHIAKKKPPKTFWFRLCSWIEFRTRKRWGKPL